MSRRALRIAILGGFLSCAVLVDSWVLPAPVPSDPEGARAPVVGPELATQRAPGLRMFVDVGPSAESIQNPTVAPARAEPASAGGSAETPVRPRAVDSSGWLGRRHSRSPA